MLTIIIILAAGWFVIDGLGLILFAIFDVLRLLCRGQLGED